MRRIAGCVIFAVTLILSVSSTRAEERTWIAIEAAGKEQGAFVPNDVPYTEHGPSVSVPLSDRQNVRTSDGQVLTGFEFIGWTEGSSIRVQVLALVPKEGVPNVYMPGGDPKNLRRRDFATYLLAPGQSRTVAEMRALGIDPMVLRTVVRNVDR